MVNVIFKGPLATSFGKEKISLPNSYSNIYDLLNDIDINGILVNNGRIKSGYIILINGKDYRLLENKEIDDNDVIEIIPINHGG